MPTSALSRPRALPRLSRLEVNPPVAFASRLAEREGNSKKPIYQMHKWWARRLGSVFRSILLAATTQHRSREAEELTFYEKNDFGGFVVLDPFVGGGTSVVEAAKCGASVIGVDIDPVACFITAKELGRWDEARLRKAFEEVERKVRDNVLAWYRTTLPDGRKGTLIYAFWVDVITCPHCKNHFDGHPHYQLFRSRTNKKQTVACETCRSSSAARSAAKPT
jgi:putative DNA methylase